MLEFAATRKLETIGDRVDLGQLLETMLYYDRVHLFLDAFLFSRLWQQVGPKSLATLLRHPTLTVDIVPEFTAVHSETRNGVSVHKPIFGRWSGREEAPISYSDTVGILRQTLRGAPGETPTRQQIQRVVKGLRVSDYKAILETGNSSHLSRFSSLISEQDTLKAGIVGAALERGLQINGGLLNQADIGVMPTFDGFIPYSSISLSRFVETEDSNLFTWGNVLAHINDYGIELQLSMKLSADIMGSQATAGMAEARIDESLNRAMRSKERIAAFESFAFDEAPYFGEAINDGRLSIEDGLRIIDDSRKFRNWVKGLPPDSDLIREYLSAVSKDTALKSLPVTGLRFSFFQGAELLFDALGAGPIGKAISAADTFMLDGLLAGWKPNVFVRKLKQRVPRRE